jgi:hypothetical protein
MKPEKLKAETLVMGIREIRVIRGKNGSGFGNLGTEFNRG